MNDVADEMTCAMPWGLVEGRSTCGTGPVSIFRRASFFSGFFGERVARTGAGRVRSTQGLTRTVNGTGHTGPSEFCATSI